jgi:hypothetical protein
MNYSFWWHCTNTGTDVGVVSASCGILPVPAAPGSCASDAIGYKCDGVAANPQSTISHTYPAPGTYTGKVIVERGAAPAAESRRTVTVNAPPAPDLDLRCDGLVGSCPLAYNSSSTLTWTATNATDCTASGDWSGSQPVSGTQSTGILAGTKVYNLSCNGPGGSDFKSVTVLVTAAPPPIVSILCNGLDSSCPVALNTAATLTWTSTSTTSCSVTPGGWTGTSGTQSTGNLAASQLYTLTCNGPGGLARDTVTASVTGAPAVCNNGVREGSEQCDDGSNNGTCPTALCSASCTWNTCGTCGNAVLEPGESCDDGDATHGGGNGICPKDCSEWCTVNTCTHLECDPVLLTCKPFAGSGTDTCTTDDNCGHNVCQGTSPGPVSCTRVAGPGLNGCTVPAQCITYYYTCVDYACTQVVGDPAGSTCGPPEPLPACPLPPGTCTMSINPNRIVIPPPRTISIDWNCQNVQVGSCVMNQGVGNVQEDSSMNVSPSVSATYTVTCTGLDGTPAAATADLKVYNFSGGVLKEIRY